MRSGGRAAGARNTQGAIFRPNMQRGFCRADLLVAIPAGNARWRSPDSRATSCRPPSDSTKASGRGATTCACTPLDPQNTRGCLAHFLEDTSYRVREEWSEQPERRCESSGVHGRVAGPQPNANHRNRRRAARRCARVWRAQQRIVCWDQNKNVAAAKRIGLLGRARLRPGVP